MPARIHEIAPDIYRIGVFAPALNLEFCHFLVKDDEPLLFHTGMRGMFPEVREAVAKVINPAALRWISFSHFEADECGALNDWLNIAPNATPLSGMIGALVNLTDFSIRPPKFLEPGQKLETGKYRFDFIPTPQLPHGWDAGVLFEESRRTLFCSDLFHQPGECDPHTTSDVLGAVRANLIEYEKSPFAGYIPYTRHTKNILATLAALNPATLGIMHGSSFSGDCSKALHDLSSVYKELLGPQADDEALPASA